MYWLSILKKDERICLFVVHVERIKKDLKGRLTAYDTSATLGTPSNLALKIKPYAIGEYIRETFMNSVESLEIYQT